MTPPPTVMADKARVQAVVEQLVASEAKVSECKVHVLLELVKYSVLTCKENGRHVPWDKWCYVHWHFREVRARHSAHRLDVHGPGELRVHCHDGQREGVGGNPSRTSPHAARDRRFAGGGAEGG